MTLVFRIILILVSICTTMYIIKRIRQSKVQIEDSIFWILFAVVLIIISIFPQIPDFFADILGIYSTVNFIFLFFIFVLLIKNFYMTIRISQMDHKIQELTQAISIKDNMQNEK
ncbi:DUF2304 domain-containing protein [Lachnospiraceae bacterium LCP25S3_G4]